MTTLAKSLKSGSSTPQTQTILNSFSIFWKPDTSDFTTAKRSIKEELTWKFSACVIVWNGLVRPFGMITFLMVNPLMMKPKQSPLLRMCWRKMSGLTEHTTLPQKPFTLHMKIERIFLSIFCSLYLLTNASICIIIWSAAHDPRGRNFHYTTASQFCQQLFRTNFKQKFSRICSKMTVDICAGVCYTMYVN